MKDRMRKENGLFAGEMSAHYYFRENFYADNGIIPFLLVLEHLSTQGQTILRDHGALHWRVTTCRVNSTIE